MQIDKLFFGKPGIFFNDFTDLNEWNKLLKFEEGYGLGIVSLDVSDARLDIRKCETKISLGRKVTGPTRFKIQFYRPFVIPKLEDQGEYVFWFQSEGKLFGGNDGLRCSYFRLNGNNHMIAWRSKFDPEFFELNHKNEEA